MYEIGYQSIWYFWDGTNFTRIVLINLRNESDVRKTSRISIKSDSPNLHLVVAQNILLESSRTVNFKPDRTMMTASSFRLLLLSCALLIIVVQASYSNNTGIQIHNETRVNPVIPGWHSDPSCVFVAEKEYTFCTSSTFLLTPGLPVHASKDLKNWKLASHAVSRESQLLDYERPLAQSDGIWAATIRYHEGNFYIITMYRNNVVEPKSTILIFKSADPYSDSAWSDPIRHVAEFIDPDIFWGADGTTYVATAGTFLQTVDLEIGNFSEPRSIWNGTTGEFLEGPHLYKKDGYYYLLVAEEGSVLNHSVSMARSKDIWGPYESGPANPILSNAHTSEYFQNVGHTDLFQDAHGQWWSAALAWRSGPEAVTYPMG
jgi:beta-xylosidase